MQTNQQELSTSGIKDDSKKPQISLIPRVALEAEARVLAFGNAKYGKGNWRLGLDYSRLIDASLRHILAYADGENGDPETGESHLAHARCCLGMLMVMPAEWDDRTKPPVRSKADVCKITPRWTREPSCLDAAYERRAIEQGHRITNPFPENML